jgi:drug/metabolite transporter (DMT)-like permease
VLAVALALASAVAYGFADFLGGATTRRLALPVVLAGSQAAGLAAIASVVALRGAPAPERSAILLATGAGIAGTIGLAALYAALAAGPMSVVAPIAGTAAIVPVGAGLAIGELPSALQNVGIVVALVGVVLASRATATATTANARRGIALAVVAAVGIGFLLVFLDAASEADPYWASLVQRVTSTSLLALALLALRPSLRTPPRHALALVAVGVLDVGGNTLFAVATTKGVIGVVSVLASLYPVVTVALARVVYRERLTRIQAAGVGAALTGVGLIAAG